MVFNIFDLNAKLFFLVFNIELLSMIGIVLHIPQHLSEGFVHNTLHLDTEAVIKNYSYPFQKHTITTKDGYILTLHRIPHSRHNSRSAKNTPILFIHGITEDSSAFLSMGQQYSAGFLFSDAGYDVWLISCRGSKYSRTHRNLIPSEMYEFWEFCFDDIGNYDLPATVDYILSTSKAGQLYIIGFSMGGAAATVLLADNPSYNSKVNALFLLAPAILFRQDTHQIVYIFRKLEEAILLVIEDINALPYSQTLKNACNTACNGPFMEMCRKAVSYMNENDNPRNDTEVIKDISEFISSVSMRTLRHFLQMILLEDFRKYDYGQTQNRRIYKQERPPAYSIEEILTPVMMFCAEGDKFVNCTDMDIISTRFSNLISLKHVPLQGHTNFVSDDCAKKYVYDVILKEMNLLEGKDKHVIHFEHGMEWGLPVVLAIVIPTVFVSFFLSIALVAVVVCVLRKRVDERQLLTEPVAHYRSCN